MKLLFDAGNTRIKSACLIDRQVESLPPFPTSLIQPQPQWESLAAPSEVLIASVASDRVVDRLIDCISQIWGSPVTRIEVEQGACGVRTQYTNPQQLGVDRWLAALAGFHLVSGAACVIDAGTALTVDVVDQSGLHRGGLIAPGMTMMVEGLTNGTAHLKVDEFSVPRGFAVDTDTAISLGCGEYIAGMLLRVAEKMREAEIKPVEWIVTGGQAPKVQEIAPFALRSCPDLVLQGIALLAENRS